MSDKPLVGTITNLSDRDVRDQRFQAGMPASWTLYVPPKSITAKEWAALLARLEAMEARCAALEKAR